MSPATTVWHLVAYRDRSYIRTRSLQASLQLIDSIHVVEILNRRSGPLRYPEVLLRMLALRLRGKRPDVLLLGFRGHEMFWPVRLIGGAPVILDAFLSPSETLIQERSGRLAGVLGRLVAPLERSVLRAASAVLTDTATLAELLRDRFDLDPGGLFAIPVGANAKASASPAQLKHDGPLRLLFYGSMRPLHGIDTLLGAIAQMPAGSVHLRLLGGTSWWLRGRLTHHGLAATAVSHAKYIPIEEIIANEFPAADLFIGGPFGGTLQAQRVITGKTFEFLSAGLPTVVGWTAEHERWGFADKVNCFIVSQQSTGELADVLIWAERNRSRLEDIAAAGKELFNENFSAAANADRLSEALHFALKGSTT